MNCPVFLAIALLAFPPLIVVPSPCFAGTDEKSGVTMYDFETTEEVKSATWKPSLARMTERHATSGSHAMEFTIPAGKWKSTRFYRFQPRDWSPFSGIEFDLCQVRGSHINMYFWIPARAPLHST